MEEWLEAAAAARSKAALAAMEPVAEEVEQGSRSPSKQKEWVEGEWLVCDHYATQRFDCQVSRN